MSDDPFVFRTRDGVIGYYGDITKAKKIDVDFAARDPIAEMRQTDHLPDPASLTIGDVADILHFIESWPLPTPDPAFDDAVIRRRVILMESVGYALLREWCQAKWGANLSAGVMQTVISKLATRLQKPFPVVRSIPLTDAVKLLADKAPDADRQGADKANKRKGKPAGSKARQQSKASTKSPKPLTLDDLTPTAWKLLRALRDMRARDSETAVGRPGIAKKAHTGNHDSKHNQEAFAQLAGLDLIDARQDVGTWITDAGIEALNKRSISG